MQNSKKVFFMVKLACFVLVATAFCLLGSEQAKAMENPELQVSDCLKCHNQQPREIEANGGKHKTEISCLDCHVEHLPHGEDRIPQCSRCHEGTAHFQLEGCLGCHTNPHMPLASLQLPEDAKTQCGTCHEQVLQWIVENQSRHAEQSCTFCHDVHGKIPDCSQCHEPHLEGQATQDCLTCHNNPHIPLGIMPGEETPVKFCAACHEEVAGNLAKTETKHGALLCTYCHKGQHPVVPQCQDCHGLPHSAAMHNNWPNCVNCHMDPHLLVK